MSLVFEKLAQALGVNDAWRLGIAGDFFRVAGCDWPVTVTLYQGGREVGRMVGMQAGDFVRDVPFDMVRVDNGATAQSVTVQVAGGGVGSDRVMGEVSIIEGGAVRSKAGQAFCGSTSITPGVGNYAMVQLWNPAASGKNVIVTELAIDLGAAGTATVRRHNASLVTLMDSGYPKLVSGAVSTAQIRSEAAAALIGTHMYGIGCDAKALVHRLSEPFILAPGWGLIVGSTAANVLARGNFQFFEEVI